MHQRAMKTIGKLHVQITYPLKRYHQSLDMRRFYAVHTIFIPQTVGHQAQGHQKHFQIHTLE